MSLSNQKYHLCRRFLIRKAAFCLVGTRAQLIQCGVPVYMRARGVAHGHLTQRFSERARMTSQCISFTCWFVCYESCGKFASLEKLLVFFKIRLQTSQVYSDINWKCVRLASCRKSKLCKRKEKKTMDATMRYRSFEENCKYWTRHVTKPNNYKVFC